MESLPCEGCKGLCCGPVPVTQQELKAIKKKIKALPLKRRVELQSQIRYSGTCIFYDLDNDKCGIYSARPEICRAFGYHKNLACFLKPDLAARDNWNAEERHVGLLSVDITWKDFK